MLKGFFSGAGALAIALIKGEVFPELKYVIPALCLGFVAYGLSIFLYVRAQNTLGAAKTSAYYSVAPFIGAFLSFVLLKEKLTGMYLIALAVMLAGTILVVMDTLIRNHVHSHQHVFTHTHDGSTHTHTVTHPHDRLLSSGVEMMLRKMGEQSNVNHVHPHKFRRTMATAAIDKGMPIEQVQRLLGHEKIDTTLHYAMVKQNNVKMSHKKYIG